MKYRKLDANGDYSLGTGADFAQNTPEAVAQAIGTRLRLWRGEWFLDQTEGTPWKEEVLGKRNGRNPDAVIKARILGTPEVTAIAAYTSQYNGETRALSITATVETTYGTVQLTEVL